MEGDAVRCRLQLLVTRPAHNAPGAQQVAPARGSSKAVRAFTPSNPIPRDENWWVARWQWASVADRKAGERAREPNAPSRGAALLTTRFAT